MDSEELEWTEREEIKRDIETTLARAFRGFEHQLATVRYVRSRLSEACIVADETTDRFFDCLDVVVETLEDLIVWSWRLAKAYVSVFNATVLLVCRMFLAVWSAFSLLFA